MRTIIILIALVLVGCGNPKIAGEASIGGLVTTAYQMRLQDGRSVWKIECNGSLNDWGNCWARGNLLCPNGYTLIDQSGNPGSMSAAVTPSGGYAIQKTARAATISCG